MHVIKIPIEKLKHYDKNTKQHPPEQIEKISRSIKEFGFNVPIIVDKDNVLIAGHGRVMAAEQLGLIEVPTIIKDDLSEAQIKAYRIADNKTAESGWEYDFLKDEFKDLQSLDYDLELTGFGEDEIITILDEEQEIEEAPADDPNTIKTDIKVGQIFRLGNHRLMCGDATKSEDVGLLMADDKADLVFTDPPYGINEKGDRSNRSGLCKGNNLSDFKDDTNQYAIDAWNICDKLNITNQVWWGANYYCHDLPLTNNWFVWDKRVEEKQKNTQSDCELAWVKSKWSSIRIFRHLWKGMMKDSENRERRVHPTQKPVALAVWGFNYFKNISLVLDLFGGSGSTLIAAEQTKRKCYMMELDPKYCQVIINRWETLTNQKAEKII